MNQQQEKTFPPPVDWDELYPGRFIKATEFKGKKPTLTISQVKIHELVGDKGPQIKGVIYFEQTDKQWALNKTNGICLKELFGRKVQDWVGHRVTLYAGQWTGPSGEPEECIRVWGSPELQADKSITIALPRKRPFQMVMHAVVRRNVASSEPTGGAKGGNGPEESGRADSSGSLTAPAKIKQTCLELRGTKTLEEFVPLKKSIWAVYAAANQEVPLDIEAAAHEHRETLESQE